MKSDRLPKEVQTEWTLNNEITDTAIFMFGMRYFGQIRNESKYPLIAVIGQSLSVGHFQRTK